MLRVGFGDHNFAKSILVDQSNDVVKTLQPAEHSHEACHCHFIPPLLQKRIQKASSEVLQEHLETMAEHFRNSNHFRKSRVKWGLEREDGQQHEEHHLTANTQIKDPKFVIYNAEHGTALPGEKIRIHFDASAHRALEGAQNTSHFYNEILGRDSIDNHHMPIVSTVHYRKEYDNAFWDGKQMVYGDGDGKVFGDFTADPDVIGHELSHGVTQYTANLEYHGQSGALNEHFSDVMGSCIKQWIKKQTVDQADWLIGDVVLIGPHNALRSMANPGHAYKKSDTPLLGNDPQPATWSNYKDMPDDDDHDNGGVHVNSGIPNHAFYLVSMALGGHSWDIAAKIWYDTMTSREITPTVNFAQFAQLTEQSAIKLYGRESAAEHAVKTAWREVEVL